MSKIKLAKELANFNAEQLRSIILDAYSASKTFKEYFEFFLNPDADKLFDKYAILIKKELNRSKWGHSKARITMLRKFIAEVKGLNPGDECVIKVMSFILLGGMINERHLSYTQTLFAGIVNIAPAMLEYGDINNCADMVMSYLDHIFEEYGDTCSNMYKCVKRAIAEYHGIR